MGVTATPDFRIDLVGAWATFDGRKLDLVVRVTSRRKSGKNSHVESTAEYHVGKEPPAEDGEVLDVWVFHKTIPDDQLYKVVQHKGGRLTCDCPHATYAKEDPPTPCAHASTVMTIAQAFRVRRE